MNLQQEAEEIKDNEQVQEWLVLECELESAKSLEELAQLLGLS